MAPVGAVAARLAALRTDSAASDPPAGTRRRRRRNSLEHDEPALKQMQLQEQIEALATEPDSEPNMAALAVDSRSPDLFLVSEDAPSTEGIKKTGKLLSPDFRGAELTRPLSRELGTPGALRSAGLVKNKLSLFGPRGESGGVRDLAASLALEPEHRGEADLEVIFERCAGSAFFKVLRSQMLRQEVCRHLRLEHSGAGTTVCTQGELGDTFYGALSAFALSQCSQQAVVVVALTCD